MAGHSKWSKVKHIKGPLDQKRGQLFSKLAKEIAVAAKLGGGDPNANPRLRSAILAAQAQSMPNDNIDRAVKRGSGEGSGVGALEDLVYEGCVPAGIAVLGEVSTDNKNRTAADRRSIFSRNHGNLASSVSVSYMFMRKGQITVPKNTVQEDRLLEAALDAGAEDVSADGEYHFVTTTHDQLYAVGEALRKAGIDPDSQKLTYIPETTIHINDEGVAAQVIRLCEALEENDDVRHVHANFDVSEPVLAKVAG